MLLFIDLIGILAFTLTDINIVVQPSNLYKYEVKKLYITDVSHKNMF